MKAELIKITEEMTNAQLVESLNTNFETMNDLAHKREIAIFARLREVESNINENIQKTDKKLNAILKHLNIDPDKDLLTDSEK